MHGWCPWCILEVPSGPVGPSTVHLIQLALQGTPELGKMGRFSLCACVLGHGVSQLPALTASIRDCPYTHRAPCSQFSGLQMLAGPGVCFYNGNAALFLTRPPSQSVAVIKAARGRHAEVHAAPTLRCLGCELPVEVGGPGVGAAAHWNGPLQCENGLNLPHVDKHAFGNQMGEMDPI